MEKGQQLSEDDKLLEITVKNKLNHGQDNKGRNDLLCKFIAEDTEDFLSNLTL